MSFSTSVTSSQRHTTVNAAPQGRTKAATRSAGIPVLPAVDVALGSVTFQTPNGYHSYQTQDPVQLETALTQAVRPARWIPELGTLVVTLAETGVRAGRNVGFRLTAF